MMSVVVQHVSIVGTEDITSTLNHRAYDNLAFEAIVVGDSVLSIIA
jgi:hypothetical protein